MTKTSARNLRSGATKSCGCLRGIDLAGQRFGRLIVVNRTDKRKGKKVLWLCQCDCGNAKLVATTYLQSGNTASCGCLYHDTHRKL